MVIEIVQSISGYYSKFMLMMEVQLSAFNTL